MQGFCICHSLTVHIPIIIYIYDINNDISHTHTLIYKADSRIEFEMNHVERVKRSLQLVSTALCRPAVTRTPCKISQGKIEGM